MLPYLNWDGHFPHKPFRTFKPCYFLQPADGLAFESADAGKPVNARYWNDEGLVVPGKAVWIPTEEVEKQLMEWAKKQGKRDWLCPDTYDVEGEESGGWILFGGRE